MYRETIRVCGLRPSNRPSSLLDLAPITTNAIDWVTADLEEADVLVNPEKYLHPDLLTDTRPISRGVAHVQDDLLRYDVIEPAQPDKIRQYINLFLVPKKEDKGRLIADGRPVNTSMDRPPRMKIPSVHQVYQFIIPEKARNLFGVRIPMGRRSRRGKIRTYRLKRLPMGWSWAPSIAQAMANKIVGPAKAVAWVDNFIYGGETKTEALQRRDELKRQLERYNCEVSPPLTDTYPTTQILTLGMEVDLASKRYRLDPEWIKRSVPNEIPAQFTLRTLFQLRKVGLAPLRKKPPAMEACRSIGHDIRSSQESLGNNMGERLHNTRLCGRRSETMDKGSKAQ